MTERRCGTCRWHDVKGFHQYYREAAAHIQDLGFCRRQPPLPDFTRLLLADQLTIDRREVFVFALWPETAAADWCGEWQSAAGL
jgi:hypothetical protein